MKLSQNQVMRNKAAIKSIAHTVYFLAKQGMIHRDDPNVWKRV